MKQKGLGKEMQQVECGGRGSWKRQLHGALSLSVHCARNPGINYSPIAPCPGNRAALTSTGSDKTIAFVTHDRSLNAKISCRTIEHVFLNKVLITRDLSSQDQP